MARIILKKRERYLLADKFYMIKNGSICAYNIFENGKCIPKEVCLKKGEIIGNFFQYLPSENLSLSIPETEIEIVAMEENTIIEEFNFDSKVISSNLGLAKIINQLLKDNIFKLFYHLYDKKGYLLAIFKFYANSKGIVSKEQIHYENFLMSKSQFYNIYTNLKVEKFIREIDKNIYLDLEKINKYFIENLMEY